MLATGIGSDVQRPLATVIVGGLGSALVLTLIALPAFYYIVEDFSQKRELRRARMVLANTASSDANDINQPRESGFDGKN
jgi:hypothetical protein